MEGKWNLKTKTLVIKKTVTEQTLVELQVKGYPHYPHLTKINVMILDIRCLRFKNVQYLKECHKARTIFQVMRKLIINIKIVNKEFIKLILTWLKSKAKGQVKGKYAIKTLCVWVSAIKEKFLTI